MNNIKDEEQFFKQLMDMLEAELDEDYEIVLHDLTKDYEHTIVDIRNGHVTNRQIGDCGSNLGLEVLRGTIEHGDRYNYITKTPDGKVLRSSSLYVKDDDNKIIASVCINKDITDSLKLEEYLRRTIKYPTAFQPSATETASPEIFVNNVNELLEHFLQEGLKLVGKTAEEMKKEDKLRFIGYLDSRGAFIISKSSERVCEFLKISKFTFYHYLEQIRS